MDATKFDAVARYLVSGLGRRQAVRGLVGGAVAVVAGGTALGVTSARTRAKCKKAGALCNRSKECCPKETDRLCKVARNASNSDTTCCGGKGAKCGGKDGNGDDKKPYCCQNLECRGTTCR